MKKAEKMKPIDSSCLKLEMTEIDKDLSFKSDKFLTNLLC